MAACCARLSKVYMITTNLLFLCLGLAFVAFGLIGYKNGFKGTILFPENIFQMIAILGGMICVAAILGIMGAYVKKHIIVYIYMIIVLCTLVFQVVIGVMVYRRAANSSHYMYETWPKSSLKYRSTIQEQFECCGYQTVTPDTCQPSLESVIVRPCASIIQAFMKSNLRKLYLVVFAALAVQLLAMSNSITMLCSSSDVDEESERRKRRKSGIKLDDMSVDTPTTAVGSFTNFPQHTDEQKNYYAEGVTSRNDYNSYNNNGSNDSNRHRYENHDMYRQNQDTYNSRNKGAYY
ncbi:Tetraspanin family-domain-containing protein [Pilobolus umbonatus]|nr:Tetraspanin family-domain-containing protein [Pilobolus umbonatus]